MLEPDLIELFVQPLNEHKIRYLVSGSVAAMLYGEPRVTHDIDLVVFLRAQDIPRFPDAYPWPQFYLPPPSVIAAEVARERRGHFNVIDTDSGLKADFYTANQDVLHAWAFRHAKHYFLKSTSVQVAPPEYVILRKLEYFREGGSEKHVRDIRSMLAVSREQIDHLAMGEWVTRLGLEVEWKRVSTF